jgi:hypothetical protein
MTGSALKSDAKNLAARACLEERAENLAEQLQSVPSCHVERTGRQSHLRWQHGRGRMIILRDHERRKARKGANFR